ETYTSTLDYPFPRHLHPAHPNLHSFPTRRSSDLRRRRAPKRPPTQGADARRRARISPRHADRNVRTPSRSRGARAGGFVRSARSDRKSTRLNSSHVSISYAVFCLKKKKQTQNMIF